MKSLLSKLESAISAQRKNSKEFYSLNDFLRNGRCCTGASGFRNGHGTKSIWTNDITRILDLYKIPYYSGNDAPRGGANGEYVELISKTMLKAISVRNEFARREIEKKAQIEIENNEIERAKGKEWLDNGGLELIKTHADKHDYFHTTCKGAARAAWRFSEQAGVKCNILKGLLR